MDVEHDVLGGHSGLHLTVRLPPCFPDTRIAEQARAAGMSQRAVVLRRLAAAEDNGLVIGYGNTGAERFPALVKRLARLARETRLERAAPASGRQGRQGVARRQDGEKSGRAPSAGARRHARKARSTASSVRPARLSTCASAPPRS